MGAPSKKIGLQVKSMGFTQNNEYFNPAGDGYTLFGYWLDLRLRMQLAASDRTSFAFGGIIEDSFDEEGLKRLSPAFTLKHREGPWTLTFGNLETVVNRHGLTDVWVAFEKPIRDPVEQGLELHRRDESSLFNLWVDWQQSTLPGMSRAERFWLGGVGELSMQGSSGWRLDGLVRVSGVHEGGQNLASSPGVLTQLNGAPGVRFLAGHSGELQDGCGVEAFAHFSRSSGRLTRAGHALELNAYFGDFHMDDRAGTRFSAVYFNSLGFESPLGGDLYQNYSRRFGSEGDPLPRRELLFLRIESRLKWLDAFELFFRFEPYIDLRSRRIEHAEALRLSFQW
jgi:hypothetical protein